MRVGYRKVGGLRWLAIGRLRVAWCVTRPAAKVRAVPKIRPWLGKGKSYRDAMPDKPAPWYVRHRLVLATSAAGALAYAGFLRWCLG